MLPWDMESICYLLLRFTGFLAQFTQTVLKKFSKFHNYLLTQRTQCIIISL